MAGIKILGTGSYLPEFVMSNDNFAAIVDTSDEWIKERTGMENRHISMGEPNWYMGSQAAKLAIEAAGLSPADIDMTIVTTVNSDFQTPSLACLIQNYLGIHHENMTMDLNVACAGLTYSMDVARRYLAAGDVQHVLLIGSERLTQMTNYEDRGTCILFGDGAGACVVTGSDEPFGWYLSGDSSGVKHLYATREIKRLPFGPSPEEDLYHLVEAPVEGSVVMNGREVYKFASRAMPKAVEEACKKIGVAVADLDWVVPHQANLRIIEAAAKKLKVPMEKVYVNIQQTGNNSSATIPICLDQGVRKGLIKRGQLIATVGFGAGLTYGANVFRY